MVAAEIPFVSTHTGIERLLDIIQETRLGFAWVEDAKNERGGLVSLRDLLLLYEKGIFSTNLLVEDVTSPIFSVDRTTTIRKALEEMFSRRIRRLFIAGTSNFVSDREITSYIFSPSQITKIAADPEKLFDGVLNDVESRPAREIDPRIGISDAALTMTNCGEDCFVSKKGIVTSWDLVMGPWIARDLRIK
jgi:CBS domain-containing protein